MALSIAPTFIVSTLESAIQDIRVRESMYADWVPLDTHVVIQKDAKESFAWIADKVVEEIARRQRLRGQRPSI